MMNSCTTAFAASVDSDLVGDRSQLAKLEVLRRADGGDLIGHRQSAVDCHAEVTRSVNDADVTDT